MSESWATLRRVTTTRLRAVKGTGAGTAQADQPRPRRVRHIVTGDVGVLDHIEHGQWGDWARVRWDPGISTWSTSGQPPGMVADGLAFVAPGLLVYLGEDARRKDDRAGQRVGR